MTQQDSHRPVNLKDDEETTMSLSKVLFRRPSECTEQKTKIFRHDSRCAGWFNHTVRKQIWFDEESVTPCLKLPYGNSCGQKTRLTFTRTAGVYAEILSTYHSNAKEYTPTSGSATSLSSMCSRRRLVQYFTQQCYVLSDVSSSTSLSNVMLSATFGPLHHSAIHVLSDVRSSTSFSSVCSQGRLVHYITQ